MIFLVRGSHSFLWLQQALGKLLPWSSMLRNGLRAGFCTSHSTRASQSKQSLSSPAMSSAKHSTPWPTVTSGESEHHQCWRRFTWLLFSCDSQVTMIILYSTKEVSCCSLRVHTRDKKSLDNHTFTL